MAEKCELLETCGFFKKYQESWSVACKNLISKYCMGPKMAECKASLQARCFARSR